MIAEFGEKACTVCFPAAPANPHFNGPGRRDREALAARQAEKDARQAAKDAKRLAADEVFRSPATLNDRVETVAACKEVLRYEVELRDYYGKGEHPSHPLTYRVLRTPSASCSPAKPGTRAGEPRRSRSTRS